MFNLSIIEPQIPHKYKMGVIHTNLCWESEIMYVCAMPGTYIAGLQH